jgi:hypothetical protein
LAIASLALICVSVSAKRAFAELPSNCTKSALMPAPLNADSMRGTTPASSLSVALPLDTCTAGASPKKLGSVYSSPTTSAIASSRYFHSG